MSASAQKWQCRCVMLAFASGCVGSINAQRLFIRANQIGYSVNAPKNAVAFSGSPLRGTFKLIDTAGTQVFAAAIKPIDAVKWGTNEHHAELDFSRFKKEGR